MIKRLLCIISSLNTGGAETFLMKVYRRLDKSKYQLDFVVNADGFYDEEVKKLGGRIFKTPLRTKHPVKSYKALKNIVKENKYEHVLKLGNSPLSVIDLIAAKRGGAKIRAMRSCNALTNLSFGQRVLDFIFRPILNKCANVKIAPSDLAAKYTFGEKQCIKGNVHILNNGVDIDVYRYDQEARQNIRNEFYITDNIVVGHIGRFSRQKNHTFLLKVFCEIKKDSPKAKLLLVGTGELETKVRDEAKLLCIYDDIVFAGVRKDVPALLSAMDIFILPSLYEGMPNTVIEAQATGLPCVISDSITRQANISGMVNYLSLDKPPEVWAKEVLDALRVERKNTRNDFIKAKYDIDSVRDFFVQMLFGAK